MFTICFTGHRPAKLGGYVYDSPVNKGILDKIQIIILDQFSRHSDLKVICGGALGIDQMAAKVAIDLKPKYGIVTEIAVPFESQDCKWPLSSVEYYRNQLAQADSIIYVDTLPEYAVPYPAIGVYSPVKMQKRNQYMVDNADVVVAFWDGTPGGTANCVAYATSQHKDIIHVSSW